MGGGIGQPVAGGHRGAPARTLLLGVVLATVGVSLACVQTARASAPSFVWSGLSTNGVGWSEATNWEGDTAPEPSSQIATLAFPRPAGSPCVSEPFCFSRDDIPGLSAETMQIDDGDGYDIYGEELALGKGGLSASPAAGTSGYAGAFIELPLHLSASQQWTVTDRTGGKIEENGLLLDEGLTGATNAQLTIEQSNGAALILDNETEIGPLTIEAPSGHERIENGSVFLEGGELNSSDGQPVNLRHIFFEGSGTVGALVTTGSTLVVGNGFEAAEGIEASSVQLDPTSAVLFDITAGGTAPGAASSELLSRGSVELNGAELGVIEGLGGGACPTLTRGETFTLLSTTGTLSGTFANAPEGGGEIPVSPSEGCKPSQKMRIIYNRGGGTHTVIGVVEGEVVEKEETAAREAKERASQELATAAARRKTEEELAAAAAKKRQEEEARLAVLSSKEGSPDARIASTSLRASKSGTVTIKVICPAGVSSCEGTVTVRTLNALLASLAGAVRSKASVLTLASGSFDVPGGGVKTVTMRLSAKARRLLARVHTLRVKVTVTAHSPTGGAHTGQSILTLRAPKPGHGKG
jgi:hypothetical protein